MNSCLRVIKPLNPTPLDHKYIFYKKQFNQLTFGIFTHAISLVTKVTKMRISFLKGPDLSVDKNSGNH